MKCSDTTLRRLLYTGKLLRALGLTGGLLAATLAFQAEKVANEYADKITQVVMRYNVADVAAGQLRAEATLKNHALELLDSLALKNKQDELRTRLTKDEFIQMAALGGSLIFLVGELLVAATENQERRQKV